jgi:uncharacterized protein
MTNKEDILNKIKKHKRQITSYGIRNVGLFGSYARDEQTIKSDIDFDLAHEKFDNFMAICDFLEHMFKGEKVEIVTKSGLSPYIGPKILKEVVYV